MSGDGRADRVSAAGPAVADADSDEDPHREAGRKPLARGEDELEDATDDENDASEDDTEESEPRVCEEVGGEVVGHVRVQTRPSEVASADRRPGDARTLDRPPDSRTALGNVCQTAVRCGKI